MKKNIVAVCFVIIFILFIQRSDLYAFNDVVPNDETGIPDKVLYQEILESLDKTENETFTKQEASSLQRLRVHTGVQSYQGIGLLSGLRVLNVDRAKLNNSQLEVIAAELPQLKYLTVCHNKLTSLQAFGNMKNLSSLDISFNSLENLEGIEQLTSLETLNAEGNKIKSISSGAELPTLKSLDLMYNQLTSLKGLERAKNIEHLNLIGNQLTNLKGIKELKNIKELALSDNQLTNLKGIEKLKKMDALRVEKNKLTSIKGIRNLKKITELWLRDNRLVKVDEIKYLKNLRSLYLSYNQIKKLPDLKKMKYLYSTDLYGNYLTEQEIRSKLPERCFAIDEKWIRREFLLQRQNFKVSFVKPAKSSKITKNTKKITGKIPNERYKKLKVFLRLPGEKSSMCVKPDKNGKFVFKKLNLKPYAGKEAKLDVYYYDGLTDRGERVNQIIFKVKK